MDAKGETPKAATQTDQQFRVFSPSEGLWQGVGEPGNFHKAWTLSLGMEQNPEPTALLILAQEPAGHAAAPSKPGPAATKEPESSSPGSVYGNAPTVAWPMSF